jgi:hypothetical protein
VRFFAHLLVCAAMAGAAGIQIITSVVEEKMEEVEDATRTSESQQPSGVVTVTVVESEPSSTVGRKRQRREPTDASSESEDTVGPVWQVGSEGGWDGSIWWKDCSEPFQAALETQYQAKIPRVKHECTTQTGRKVYFRHNLEKMLQTNLSNGITKMLRRISAISPPL